MRISVNYRKLALLIFPLFLFSCKKCEPIRIDIINSCQMPVMEQISNYNDDNMNNKLFEYLKDMPADLRQYLNLKITNRLIQHEMCKTYVEQLESYNKCILFLIDKKNYDYKSDK